MVPARVGDHASCNLFLAQLQNLVRSAANLECTDGFLQRFGLEPDFFAVRVPLRPGKAASTSGVFTAMPADAPARLREMFIDCRYASGMFYEYLIRSSS